MEKAINHIPAGKNLVDVRTAEEYRNGHLPGAVNVPLEKIDSADIPDGSVLYCRSGRRSGLAKQMLESRGIKTENAGGIEDYSGLLEYPEK